MADEVIVNDQTIPYHINPLIDGERKAHGLVPRDYTKQPFGSLMYAKPFDLDLIPENEWQERLNEQIAAKAQLSDVRNKGNNGQAIPSRDQNGFGYCWCHSATSAILLARAIMNEPYLDLSAYAVGCIIKNYKNEGGWGGEAVEFIGSRGIPTSEFWPQKSTDRANDKPETWANAAKQKNIEWMDLQGKNKAQFVTCLLLGIPVVGDYNFWSHSVLVMDLVSINPFKIRLWNSWSDGWGENGTGYIEGEKATPDGALGVRVVSPSV